MLIVRFLGCLLLFGLLLERPVGAQGVPVAPTEARGTVGDTVCPLIESAAHANRVPVALLTRLIWTESRFQADAVSPKGAQGIAQFMPGTAVERGLADPFDPEQAVPEAARLIADSARRFGNFGLAAAAYNAGADRVADWLAGTATLPGETAAYVVALTGVGAEDWARGGAAAGAASLAGDRSCIEITDALRTNGDIAEGPVAPWGVQLAGNFSKAVALASFERVQQRYRRIVGDARPMILGGVLRSRGTRRFYRVMLPEASRADADRTCQAIARLGGACVPVRT